MKRIPIVVTGAVMFLLLASQVMAGSFRAVIHENFERRASAEPCEVVAGGFTCPGSGTVQGYGQVTSEILFPDGGEPNVRTLTFADGSTLVLNETNIDGRFPGRSGDAPGAQVGYGNPSFSHYAWVVAGGTGTFANASGSGEWVNVQAGDTIVLKFWGTLTRD